MKREAHKPIVSIIVRTVNRPAYLREALASIRRQDYSPVEAVIVNDGGPSVEDLVAEELADFNYKLIENKNSLGRAVAGNIGIDNSAGEFIGFLDDDDILYPYHVSTLLETAQSTEHQVVYADALKAEHEPDPNSEIGYSTRSISLVYSYDYSRRILLQDNFIPIQCLLFHRSLLDRGIRFDSKLHALEDWDFWLQLSVHTDFYHVKEITSEFRIRTDNTNTTTSFEHVWEEARKYVKSKWHSERIRYGITAEGIWS
ncbi:MAG: glycosyltransferase [Candidatus Dadabacteria bacterium]|nr:MAG: glycosyltransferase [Candidatus Dadabacteria bacterium]